MKKIFTLIFSVILLFLFTSSANAEPIINKKINKNIKTKRIPAGTLIKLKLLEPLS